MASSVIRNLLTALKISTNSKIFLNVTNVKNAKIHTRSLCSSSRSQDFHASENITFGKQIYHEAGVFFCFLPTEGEKKFLEVLDEEMKKCAQVKIPFLEDYSPELMGAHVELLKTVGNEEIVITSDLTDSLDVNDFLDPFPMYSESKCEKGVVRSKPEFTVKLNKGGKTLEFFCSYIPLDDERRLEKDFNDVFDIKRMTVYIANMNISYSISKETMSQSFYGALMDYLNEKGISHEFAKKLSDFFSCYNVLLQYRLYQGVKFFVKY